MEGGNEGYSKNWLKEYVDERGVERVQRAATHVFDRMRVVEQLFMHKEQEILAGGVDEEKARSIIQNYNNGMEYTIRNASAESKESLDAGFYYVPLNTSDEVIRDGVSWFKKLQEVGQGDLKFENVSIDQMIRQLFVISRSKEAASELLEKSTGNLLMSDVVIEVAGVKDEIPESKPVGTSWTGKSQVEQAADIVGMRLSQAQTNMDRWMTAIAPDVDRLYSETSYRPVGGN